MQSKWSTRHYARVNAYSEDLRKTIVEALGRRLSR